MHSGRAIVIRGNARQLPLPDESVDLLVTSPPYYSLRAYADRGEVYSGQIGAEPTPRQYIESLMECTREWVRVLKPSGSIFVNLGDTYSSVQGVRENHDQNLSGRRKSRGEGKGFARSGPAAWGVPSKSLIGIPWRYALACIDEGLILRRDIIWSKTNGVPESVDDRCRTSHEYIFHIVKARRYFTGIDEIREPHSADSFARFAPGRALPGRRPEHIYNGHPGQTLSLEKGLHPAGRLPGSVWTIPVQPLIGPACRLVWDGRTLCWFSTWDEGERHMRMLARDSWMWAGTTGRPSLRAESEHYAAFPMELPRRIIQGWSPSGICAECGQGRRPVASAVALDANRPQARRAQQLADSAGLTEAHLQALLSVGISDTGRGAATQNGTGKNTAEVYALADEAREALGGYAREYLLRRPTAFSYACACPDASAPTRPSVVLDPFGGTGCAALVAASLGRTGISVDYSHSYSRFARWRTASKTERAKAMQVKKPPPPPDHRQGALFDMEEM